VEGFRGVTEREGSAWNAETLRLAERVLGALGEGPLRELMSRGAAEARWGRDSALEALRERPVAAKGSGDGARLVLGRIDRLVLARRGGRVVGAEIVDFKTDSGGGNDGAVAALHGPQLLAYRGAVAGMYGLDAGRVTCAVALVLQGRVVRMG